MKESKTCSKSNVDYEISSLEGKYIISATLISNNGKLFADEYNIEIWLNLNSHTYIINIYEK